jgi:hypothetical protein
MPIRFAASLIEPVSLNEFHEVGASWADVEIVREGNTQVRQADRHAAAPGH